MILSVSVKLHLSIKNRRTREEEAIFVGFIIKMSMTVWNLSVFTDWILLTHWISHRAEGRWSSVYLSWFLANISHHNHIYSSQMDQSQWFQSGEEMLGGFPVILSSLPYQKQQRLNALHFCVWNHLVGILNICSQKLTLLRWTICLHHQVGH